MRPKGQVSRGGGGGGGGELWLSETESRSKFAVGGGAHFERVSVSQLGGSGAMLPWQMFRFKPSEMAGNAFKTNMVW